ncbi:MAG: DUF58 domain-containing protein [Planctomycetales bacterium]|nr:DUF58 domain-containing protein [Planctomycetales bacterium]
MSWWVGVTLLLLLALVLQLGMVAYAIYVFIAVVLISRLLSARWGQSLTATRDCSRLEASVGDRVAVMVNVTNQGGLPIAWTLLEDLLPREALMYRTPALRVEGRRVLLTVLRSGQTRQILYQIECNRRGYYQLGPLVMETGDLFGLHRKYRVASQPHFLMVLPKIIPLAGYDIASRRPIGEVRMSYQLYEDPTRIAGVRAYQAGDPLNRIHWGATARTAELHSKVYEPSTIAGATILLEFHQQAHDASQEPFRSELAITAAASVANAMFEMGQQVGLVTNARDAADRIRVEGWDYDLRTRKAAIQAGSMLSDSDRLQPLIVRTNRGPEQLMRIIETLARAELTDGLTLPELITETASQLPRDATVLAILPSVTAESAIALGLLKRRGFAVAAIINVFDRNDFADASGPLLAQGIPTYHLPDEDAVSGVCRRIVARG